MTVEIIDGYKITTFDNGAVIKENYIEPTVPTFDELKAEKLNELIAKRNAEYQTMLDSYPMDERETFRDRNREAVAYQEDNLVTTPFIDASLPIGFTATEREAEITAVYQKALYISSLSGASRDLRNSIENATTATELDAIVI